MTRTRTRAMTLFHVLVIVTIVCILGNMAAYVLNQTMILQRGAASWSNDDAVIDDVLAALRQDVAGARSAELEADGVLALRDSRSGLEVRYSPSASDVVRRAALSDGKEDRRTWRLGRFGLRWVIERGEAGGTVVWTTVEIPSAVRSKYTPERSLLYRYAVALCLGSTIVSGAQR